MEDQNFLTNFIHMTFEGKGIFWAACGIILIIVLFYMFSSKIRDFMKKTTRAWLILPVVLIGVLIYFLIQSNSWVSIKERTEPYNWEMTTKASLSKVVLDYSSDVKDPATGKPYEAEFRLEKPNDWNNSPDNRFFIKNDDGEKVALETANDDFTLISDDGSAEITFSTDGTYLFFMESTGVQETGQYRYTSKGGNNNEITLTKDSENSDPIIGTNGSKTSHAFTYISDTTDPETNQAYEIGFTLRQREFPNTYFSDAGWAFKDFSIVSEDGTAEITFRRDGTYVFRVESSGAEETGTYNYDGSVTAKKLTLTKTSAEANDSDEASGTIESEKASKKDLKFSYESDAVDPATDQPYQLSFILERDGNKDSDKVADNSPKVRFSAEGAAIEDFTVTSTDGNAEITFKTDNTYRFFVPASGTEETGEYIYRNKRLTVSNATGSAGFWKNIREIKSWLFLLGAGIVLMVLVFLFNDKIRAFLKKHPLVWLCIPAALLIYFVYVAIGWNIWVSVSDWPEGKVMPTYGWGGFGQYAKMFGGNTGEYFWNAVGNTLLLFLIIPICLLLGLALALVMDHGLRGTSVFRTLILLPFSLSFVVTGAIWQQMYRGDDKGIILKFFSMFGIDSSGILWMSSDMVMISIMIVMIWQFSGYVAVIFLAAIKNVPTNIINAGKLDGAYMPRIYWKLIIPQLKGAMGSCITILAMYALRSFDLIVSLTNEANSASQTLPVLMYYEGFKQNNYAYAAAISCFLLALVLILILPLTYWTNRRKA